MVDEAIDAGFGLVSNQGVLAGLLKKGVITRDFEQKIGKSKMRYSKNYQGLQTLVNGESNVRHLGFLCKLASMHTCLDKGKYWIHQQGVEWIIYFL